MCYQCCEKTKLSRDPVNGKIKGVCAGLARYLDIQVSTVRILTVIGFIIAPVFSLLSYVIATLVLDEKVYV